MRGMAVTAWGLCLWAGAFCVTPSRAAQAGTIRGVVSTKARGLPPVRVSFDQKACGLELPDASIVVDAAGRLANAVVTVVGVKARSMAREIRVLNERCRFVPRVQVAAPGATVKTSSADLVLHTTVAQRADGRQLFNVALPGPGIEIAKPLGPAEVLRVGCNTHAWMRAWIVVTDEMSAVTGPDGSFTFPDMPAGTYHVRVWHESLRAGPVSTAVVPGKDASLAIEMR